MKQAMLHIGVTLLGVLLLTLPACNSANARGAETKEQVVDAYLYALERKDERSILLLIPHTHIAEQAVRAKLEQLGGHALRAVQVDYLSDFGPKMAKVTIRGVYMETQNEPVEFRDEIYIRQIEDRWYLILGRHKDGIPTSISPMLP